MALNAFGFGCAGWLVRRGRVRQGVCPLPRGGDRRWAASTRLCPIRTGFYCFGPAARAVPETSRGIGGTSPRAASARLRPGASDSASACKRSGFGDERLEASGLFSGRGERFRGMAVIPELVGDVTMRTIEQTEAIANR